MKSGKRKAPVLDADLFRKLAATESPHDLVELLDLRPEDFDHLGKSDAADLSEGDRKAVSLFKEAARVRKAEASPPAAVARPAVKPIKDALSKAELIAHLSSRSGVEPRGVKAVLVSLEATIAASLHKKGARVFTLPGVLKATAVAVPAKPKRRGKNPFTGEERTIAAKPASVKVKIRALKKLRDVGFK